MPGPALLAGAPGMRLCVETSELVCIRGWVRTRLSHYYHINHSFNTGVNIYSFKTNKQQQTHNVAMLFFRLVLVLNEARTRLAPGHTQNYDGEGLWAENTGQGHTQPHT